MALFGFGKSNESLPVAPGATARATAPNITAPTGGGTVPMEDLLRLCVEEGASDLHITVGAAPALRLRGHLVKLDLRPLAPDDTEALARAITSEANFHRLNESGSVDFGFTFRETSRFRVNVYREKGNIAIALRLIPRELLTLEQIFSPAGAITTTGVPGGLPPHETIRSLLDQPRGLILVTGPTGSGKSTSLASMLNVINESSQHHIITIEDPIEYYHDHQRGLINQRELGVDVPSFSEGLKRALRQDPDVILVGEMRDLETMETAITAAETGHLVFSTLHTTGAARTVDRIIDAFPSDQQAMIRVQLSTNLKAVISQLLIPKLDGTGRIAAYEIMVNTPSIAALIRDNKTFRIGNDILTGAKYGMVSLEQCLVDLYLKGMIHYEQVITKSQDADSAKQLIGTQQPRRR